MLRHGFDAVLALARQGAAPKLSATMDAGEMKGDHAELGTVTWWIDGAL